MRISASAVRHSLQDVCGSLCVRREENKHHSVSGPNWNKRAQSTWRSKHGHDLQEVESLKGTRSAAARRQTYAGITHLLTKRWLIALSLWVLPVTYASAQVCLAPGWSELKHSGPTATNLTDQLLAIYDNQPGVSYGAPSCSDVSGNTMLGNAVDSCISTISCGPPTCSSQQSYPVQFAPQESCSLLFAASAVAFNIEQAAPNVAGDPVNPANGSVYTTETDVAFSGTASGLTFSRYYSSASPGASDLAPGWTYSYSRHVVAQTNYAQTLPAAANNNPYMSGYFSDPGSACTSSGLLSGISAWRNATTAWTGNTCQVLSSGGALLGTIIIYYNGANLVAGAIAPQLVLPTPVEYDVTRDDGSVIRFVVINGVLTPPAGTQMKLGIGQTGYVLTDKDDTVETYSASGVLLSVKTRAGITKTMGYNAAAQLSTVTDSFGNVITLNRAPVTSRLSGVTSSGGGTVSYAYDVNNRLSTSTFPDTTLHTYVYENTSFPSALTGLIDENSVRLTSWAYDSYGRATSTSQAGGANAATLSYNSAESVQVTDALGASRTFSYTRVGDRELSSGISGSICPNCTDEQSVTYDAAGFVSSRMDYKGNLSCYANDPVRGLELVRVEGFAPASVCPANLATYTPLAGTIQRKISTSWHATYHLPLSISEFGRTSTFTYDSSGNQLTRTVTDTTVSPNVARTWTYTYDSYGRVLTAKGPRTDLNSTTTYAYYPCTTGAQCGQVQTVQDALGHVTTTNTYSGYGQPLTITDPNGVVTTLAFDTRQRLTSRKVGSELTGFTYYPTGSLHKLTLPDSSTIQYTYDQAHRLTNVTDSLGNSIAYTLDALGNRTAQNSYDPANTLHRTHTRAFNTLDELYQDVNAAGSAAVTTTYGYDSNGNPTSVAAPMARNTTKTYDALNRLTQVTDPANGNTYFSYDPHDQLVSVEDPRTLTTSYGFNGFGNVTSQVSPDTGTTTNTYDSGGNLASGTDARGAIATYSYDALNRVHTIAYKLSGTTDQTLTFTYDSGTNGIGRLRSAADASESTSWSYDFLGRVLGKGQTIGSVTKSVGYAYTNGNLTTLTTPSGQSVTYAYNSNHQVASIAVNGTTILSGASYEPFGPVHGWTWGNSTSDTRTFNGDGLVTQIAQIETTNYGYDNASRIATITNATNGSLSYTYGYDTLDRITSAAQTSFTAGFTYDADGNRLTQTGTYSTTQTPSTTSNRLASITGYPQNRTYSYDAAGDVLSNTANILTYNDRGRMKTAQAGSSTTTYLVNALGQRIEKSGGSAGTVIFMYDESGHLLGEYTSTGALTQETVWLGDTPVATLRPNGSGISIYYVHADHLNTPKIISQPSSNKAAWRWDQDPFGSLLPTQNPQGLGSFVYNLRFPGQYYDQESGLNYNYRRDYDSGTDRYIESDPLGLRGGSYSTYVYAAANPVQFTDPFGLDLTVTLYQGTADHIGIGVNSPSTYGYYPAANGAVTPTGISVPGIEKPDAGEIPIDSITIPTDPQQDAAVLQFIRDRINNPGKYNLYTNNCAITVEAALNRAKISAPNDILPKNLFDWLKQQFPQHAAGTSQ